MLNVALNFDMNSIVFKAIIAYITINKYRIRLDLF